jgi:hypothetical protein
MIHGQCEQLELAIAQLGNELAMLTKRLTPVLRNDDGAVIFKDSKPEPVPGVPLAAWMSEQVHRIDDVSASINRLIDRLGI